MRARDFLAQARELYDDPQLTFARSASNDGWRTGFASGAEWMRSVMAHSRGFDIPLHPAPYNALGIFKYGLASLCALLYLAVTAALGWWLLLPGFVLVFYAVEVQMVFLFPLAIDGSPLSLSRDYTRRAGGTFKAMVMVMQFAAVMLFGGFLGGGFIRSWALGCLSVVLWYEEIKRAESRFA